MRFVRMLASVLSLVCVASSARAETLEEKAVVWDHPLSVGGMMGLGTPVGWIGLTANVTPVRWLTLGGGVGHAFDGFQEEGHLRLRIPIGFAAVTFGGGVSTGPYVNGGRFLCSVHDDCERRVWNRAWWRTVDVAFEMRQRDGLELRAFWGVMGQVDTPATSCFEGLTKCGLHHPSALPYIGIALGYAFGG